MRSLSRAGLALAVCGVFALTACGSPGGNDAGKPDSGQGGGGTAGSGGSGGTGGSGGAGGQAGGAGGGAPFDAGPDWGQDCGTDGDCPSGLCRSDFPGMPTVCVLPCTRALDCAVQPDFFCEPFDAGSAQGWCLPHSAVHCLECVTDSDCGSMSAVCTSTANDAQRACHVDCTLGGDAACPFDYSCVPQTVDGGSSRMLCVPTTGTCQDALGGFCDRLTLSPACHVSTDAGSCGGQRYCIGGGRFDLCSAPAPQCKTDCAAIDHAGCTETFCPAAVSTPQNCGTCGTVCPGLSSANTSVTCVNAACSLACLGENYDVDGLATTGCEVVDSPTGNHLTGTPTQLGDIGCSDSNTVANSGKLPSDARVHSGFDAALGFDSVSGSAPDVVKVHATGGTFCVDDLNLTLTVTNSSALNCYRLGIVTSNGTYTCNTNTGGTCNITSGSGSYSDNSDIFITVSKTCSAATAGNPSYSFTGHI